VTEQPVPAASEAPPEGGNGTDAGPGPAPEPEASARAEIAGLESQLLRALADLDNMRKRLDREVVRQRAAERAEVAASWLPVVDNLERALQHAGANSDPVLDGVRAVRDQAVAVLARLGYPRYGETNRPFDPARDEAAGAVNADAPPGTVIAVVRPGYGGDQTVLRPATVIVSKGPNWSEGDTG
jgi:molecular chaperone GrpE